MTFVPRRSRLHGTAATVTAAALVVSASVAFSAGTATAISVEDSIPVGDSPSYMDILPDGSRAYVSSEADDSVEVFTLATQVTSTIAVGDQPYGVTVRPGGGQVWVANFNGDSVSVISTATDTVIATIPVDNGPWAIDFSPNGQTAYVSHYLDDSIVPISATTLTRSTSLTNGEFAQGIAVEPSTGDVWTTLTNADQVSIVDPANPGAPILIPVDRFPRQVIFSVDGSLAFVSNNDVSASSVSVISTATRTVIDEIVVGGGYLDALSVSPDGVHLFTAVTATDTTSTLHVIDIATRTPLYSMPAGHDVFSTAMTPDGNRLYVVSSRDDEVLRVGLEVGRLAGATRYETAVAVSTEAFPGGSAAVYVANGADFPDALAAGPAAATRNAPLLLVTRDSVPAVVSAEITRLFPGTIYIVGGTGVISSAVEAQLALTGADIVRLAGPDRYETGRRVVANAYGLETPSDSTAVDVVYIATGRQFPDALSAGPAAARAGGPVVLVDGAASSVPASTLALLDQLNPDVIKIAGGTGVVSPAIEAQLSGLYSVTRVAGADRYTTSAAINDDAFDDAATVLWATGTGFPDALAGVALAAQVGGPITLVRPTCAPVAAKSDLWRLDTDQLFLLGGTGSLSTAVQNRVGC
ncbi:cell wall-binding repeat-containing protein [Microcella sp.]|uniref:cell wall-binding repeat-containing protein n=1 Tax=Microcella sp. TaxID=1913979 RepID=UPI00255D5D91|nr:cell wall-binding repeat-containing protein [Microcella sp.]MBX9472595.1 cell wall-binding repeat-containing protein [Microcella sp.]